MSEKKFTEISDDAQDEQEPGQSYKAELAEEAGRRRSVALNIVENPLRVSFAIPATSSPVIVPSFDTDTLYFTAEL
jgi:hypothetical protein